LTSHIIHAGMGRDLSTPPSAFRPDTFISAHRPYTHRRSRPWDPAGGTVRYCVMFFICNTYGTPASVANKRLTVWLNPLNATLTKTGGGAVASDCPPSLHSTLPPIFRTLFQVAYLTTPLSAPLAKTAGCVPTIPIPKLALATPHSSLAIPPAGSILWVAI